MSEAVTDAGMTALFSRLTETVEPIVASYEEHEAERLSRDTQSLRRRGAPLPNALDVAVEAHLIRALRGLGRSWTMYSEEAGSVGTGGASDWHFVVDPIDASHNACLGLPVFATSVALYVGDKLTAGWVLDITRRITYSGVIAHGAWRTSARGKSTPIRANRSASLADAVVGLIGVRSNFDGFRRIAAEFSKIRMFSCSSLDICLIASGALDAFVDLSDSGHEKVLDVAASAAILVAAGGVLGTRLGDALDLDRHRPTKKQPVLAAANAALSAGITEKLAFAGA